MPETSGGRNIDPRPIMEVFARYGMRKTSMEDIARAADMSRPWIYKKFGSKKACYDWVVEAFLAEHYGRIFDALELPGADPFQALLEAFDVAVGEVVDLVRHEHGAELLNETLQRSRTSKEDWPLRYVNRVGDFLVRHHFVTSREAGNEKAFALITASRGFLVEAASREEIRFNMKRVLHAVLSKSDQTEFRQFA